jgi:hypothetical protein
MPENKDDKEFLAALQGLEPLEDVPVDVSKRFNETLSRLIREKEDELLKPSRKYQFSSFSIAASFLVVVAFGGVVTLNTQSEVTVSSSPSSELNKPTPDVTSDQNLFSNDQDKNPKSSATPIKLLNSNSNYDSADLNLAKSLEIGSDWGTTKAITGQLNTCLSNLLISDYLSAVDQGTFRGQKIQAAWSPVGPSSWNVYLIDASCNVIEKKYIAE